MTQVARYGHMLNVNVTKMTMRVSARFRVTGAVLNDTVEGEMLGADTTLELESPDPPERVAKVIRNAERGCFVRQALVKPVSVNGKTLLNGRPLS
jgi:organic hydroperoxide reductase OsmC/OhrA